MTTGGVITLFDVPPNSYNLSGLAAGSDGNIWFNSWGTYSSGDAVNVLSTSGVLLNSYPLPQRTDASGLATGPNGDVWLASHYFIGDVRSKGIIKYRARANIYSGNGRGNRHSPSGFACRTGSVRAT